MEIPDKKTKSAHLIPRSRNFVTAISTSLLFHSFGSIAATVNNPRGGKEAFLETNFNACPNPQNVTGTSGFTSNIFMMILPAIILSDLRGLKRATAPCGPASEGNLQ